jgi:hypothetical protein
MLRLLPPLLQQLAHAGQDQVREDLDIRSPGATNQWVAGRQKNLLDHDAHSGSF